MERSSPDPKDGHERAPQVGETVTGEITDLAYGGLGVLRAAGWVVMVPRAFPGDRVRVLLHRRRRGYFEGEATAIEAPGPDRVPPACPHVEVCGGCPLQGLSPEAQVRWKTAQALTVLERLGRVTPETVAPTWPAPEPWHYRNKMEFTFSRRPWVARSELAGDGRPPERVALGLHPRGRYAAVFDVEDCRLQSPLSNRVVGALRERCRRLGLAAYESRADEGLLRHLVVRQSAGFPDLLLVLVVRQEDPALPGLALALQEDVPEVTGIVASVNLRRATVARGDYDLPLLGEPTWREAVDGLVFRIGASSFFQTQSRGAAALAHEVVDRAACGAGARVLDLYCGAGTLSLPLARAGARVTGIEVLAPAVAEARANAAANGIRGAEFHCAEVEDPSPQDWETGAWDAVVLDPPRAGLHPRALRKLRALRPPRIVYVSCNPSTLARDAGVLIGEDGYRARALRVFDLFPQTPHLESVLLLTRP